jgi:hypothetical protein
MSPPKSPILQDEKPKTPWARPEAETPFVSVLGRCTSRGYGGGDTTGFALTSEHAADHSGPSVQTHELIAECQWECPRHRD